jgi:hypothetical protein
VRQVGEVGVGVPSMLRLRVMIWTCGLVRWNMAYGVYRLPRVIHGGDALRRNVSTDIIALCAKN